MNQFSWDAVNRNQEGKVILLYRHQRIFDEGVIKPNMKVMDVGGWGILAIAIREFGADCLIMDNFSPDQYFPDRVRALPHLEADITDRNSFSYLAEDSFDVICCFEMLEHCSDQLKAVRNMYSLLKKGGKFVGTVPTPGYAHKHGEEGIKFLDASELADLLTAVNFKIELIEPTPSVHKVGEECSSLYFKAFK